MNLDYLHNKVNKYLQMEQELNPLYHYTSVYRLEGIIKNKELWVSHSDFLNDKTERQYTFNLFYKILVERAKKASLNFRYVEGVLKIIKDFEYPAYVLSLSKNKDSNLLWSNYSQNDGYNIKFDFSSYRSDLSIDQEKAAAICLFKSKVIYDEKTHHQAINELVDDYIELFKKHDEHFIHDREWVKNNPYITQTVTNLHITFLLFSAFFKDACFKQEEEHRVALVPTRSKFINFDCRILNGAFIPYIKIKLKDSQIKGVTIGPKNKMDISEEGLRYFLELNNLSEIDIKQSKIPYRY
ncbi:DUF2971 domain-containing protein [Bacillus pumilus]|uniref:DUF2971 domain-containing protein n=1 Tax=Bacillus pumilus TaxID=1408 RepID=UPI00285E629E|nr:DUF2971 domain-containing protein [Bacillus pumilus]MDR7248944.1 hypothetical protein [Bacillus pumilus]